MRVIVLSVNYWPEVTGIGALTTYRAEYLSSVGHEIEVCTTFPYYPDWKVPPEYKGKLGRKEKHNGVSIVRSYAYVPNSVTPLRRILFEASFIIGVTLRALLRKRPDVLLVVSPPLGLAATAILLSRLWSVPYVFDVEDLQPDSASDLGMLPRWAVKLLYKVENAAYRHARLVTTLTQSMRQKIIDKGFREDHVELFEPRMDGSLIDLLPEEGDGFRRRYDLEEKFLVTYSGNMGVKQGLDVILDAAALNRGDDSMLFLCAGNGVDCERIKRRAAELDLANVRFLPLLDEKDFRGLLAASNVCLVTQQHSVSEIAFPSKIVTYLAAGRPIIASVNPECEVARITRESGAGRVVEAENPLALLEAVRGLRNADLCRAGENGRAYASMRWSSGRVLEHLERSLAAAAGSPMSSLAWKGFKP
jgi:colanic acid biosynthesis glycosyl transferase WcaI